MSTAPNSLPTPPPDVTLDGVTRRSTLKWMTLAWTGFAAATAAGLTATVRFLFPNVLFEPPTRFKAGEPSSYALGVDERWKEKFGVWIVRDTNSIYALVAVCVHLGCTPNWLQAQNKFKCPCHGSGYYVSGINFEGPAPRPLERAEIGDLGRGRADHRGQGDALPLRAGPVERPQGVRQDGLRFGNRLPKQIATREAEVRLGSRWRDFQQASSRASSGNRSSASAFPTRNRKRVLAMLGNVVLHLHPVKTRKSGVKMRYTWCAGGVTFFLFLVLTFTGLLLMFYYRPTVEYAFVDILDLREQVPFGIMREVHRWGAHAMVISVWIHMFRVFMTGSYKPPREFNWVIGVILLVLTLLLSFTGYLLPWDQLAIWAITVGSNMASATPLLGIQGPGTGLLKIGDIQLVTSTNDARFGLLGGRFVGAGALLRFYVLHCVGIPLIAAFLMAVHFWRVRKDGGISGPV